MRHTVPFLVGLLTLISLEIFYIKPKLFLLVAIILAFWVLLAMLIAKARFVGKLDFIRHFANSLIFLWSFILLALFFENPYLKHAYAIGVSVYLFFYFENLFYYLISKTEESRWVFLRITNLMNVLSVFFLSAGLHGIKTFIQLPIWVLTAIFLVFFVGLSHSPLILIKNSFKKISIELLVFLVIFVELFIVLYFLPIAFFVNGAVLSVAYYICSGLLINYLKYGKTPYLRYVPIGSILILLLLLTARWV